MTSLNLFGVLITILFLNALFVNGSIWGNTVMRDDGTDPPPQFSSTYSVQGTLHIPYAEIEEPFYAWYSGNTGASRIDYYGGMVKTYQLSSLGEYGALRKIAPITTEAETNRDTCLQVNGTKDGKVMPQSILPDLTGFQYIGDEVIAGEHCQKWKLVEIKGEKTNKYSMWIKYQKSTEYTNDPVPVPIRYEMRGYNTLLGSHFDHYYLDYQGYSSDTPSQSVFELVENMTCQGFPGPGDKHIYTFNPVKEFVNNYEHHVDTAFDQFKRTHQKKYVSEKEHGHRKNNFRHNLRYIHSKNRANLGFQLAVNHLADRTDTELKALRGKQYTEGYNGGLPFPHSTDEVSEIPKSLDWRLYGAVTPVKDQSVCGSCWSFGTVGTIEGAYFLKSGSLVRISQQALIDCSWGYGNNGCDGGEDFRSYQWMMKHGGLPTEDEYGPYLGQDGYCHVDNVTLTAKITGYVNVTSGDLDALRVAVAKQGPISVAIDASHKTLSFYANGIYYEPECGNKPEQLDHAVLVVGYGHINGKPYWLVKNSWSTYWGNDGYVLMSQDNNNCGVATDPTYVLM